MEVSIHLTTSATLQTLLQSTLPYSINIACRTRHPNQSPHARLLATFPPSVAIHEIPKCWAVAYVDRSSRPETELWMTAAGELPGHLPSQSLKSEEEFCRECRRAVLSLVDSMSRMDIPPVHPDNLYALDIARQHEKEYPKTGPNAKYPSSPATYMRHLLNSSVVTLGAVHHQVIKVCQDAGLWCKEFPGFNEPLNMFVFRVSDMPKSVDLPEELYWGEVSERDFAVVQARTTIPRPFKTMRTLRSVGAFEKATDTPIAWAFLGVDGSLTTLHTEPKYRGKGIARAVTARLLEHGASELAVDSTGCAWAHANVYMGNQASENVCRSLRGYSIAKIYWARIDIGKAGALATHNDTY